MRFLTQPGAAAALNPQPAVAAPSWLRRVFSLNTWLQLVGAAGGLWGNYLITEGAASGFLLWMISNAALIWLQLRMRLWTLVGLHFAYLFLCVKGIAEWYERAPQSIPAWIPAGILNFLSKIL
jgi:hypothetical protein